MKILELFSGTESFSKVARAMGHETITVDNNQVHNPTILKSILDFDIKKDLPKGWKPDIIWASPPCRTFSIASCYRHWDKNRYPKTSDCFVGLAMVKKTLEIIGQLNPKFWVIENPRGMLRKQPLMIDLPKTTVSYCQYGDKVMKPTDLWNNFNFIGKICKNGMPCHESAKRGSDRGTQAQNRCPIKRAIVPEELCREILNSIDLSQNTSNMTNKENEE